eukprot:367327-Prorocentrum_minimum.AAC.1
MPSNHARSPHRQPTTPRLERTCPQTTPGHHTVSQTHPGLTEHALRLANRAGGGENLGPVATPSANQGVLPID